MSEQRIHSLLTRDDKEHIALNLIKAWSHYNGHAGAYSLKISTVHKQRYALEFFALTPQNTMMPIGVIATSDIDIILDKIQRGIANANSK